MAIEPKTSTGEGTELALIQGLIDRLPDWVFIGTLRAVIVCANETAAKALGYPKDELAGKDLSFFYDQPTLEKVQPDLERVRQGEVIMRVRPFKVRNGDILSVEITNTVILIDGAPHFFVVGRDITHRIAIERNLRELAAVVRATDMSVIIADSAGFITYANRGAQAVFGYEPSELIGKPISIFQPARMRPDYMHNILQQTLAGGFRGEVVSRRKNGEEFMRYLITSPVYDTEGAPVALVGISHDITHEKQLEAELHERARQVEHLREMIQFIGSSAAGVFETPLAESVATLLQAVNAMPAGDPVAGLVFDALRSAQKVLHKMPLMVNFAKLRTGQYPLRMTEVDLHSLLDRLAAEYGPIARQMGVRFEVAFETEPSRLLADEALVWGVLMSLVDNALDHTGPQGRVSVRVLPPQTVNTVLLCVEDSGTGIAPESLARAFSVEENSGSGIGLAFCKLAVETHEGHIWGIGEPGRGSIFSISIPLRPSV